MTVTGGFTTVSYRYVTVSQMKPVTDPLDMGDDSARGDNNNNNDGYGTNGLTR